MNFYQQIKEVIGDEDPSFISDKNLFITAENNFNPNVKCERCGNLGSISNQRYFPIGKYHVIHNASVSAKPVNVSVPKPIRIKNVHKDIQSNTHGYLHNIATIAYLGSGKSGHFWAKIRSKCNDNYYFECNDEADPYKRTAYFKIIDEKTHMYFFKIIDKKI